jgi:cobyrinic acid a,c-diamide synthase
MPTTLAPVPRAVIAAPQGRSGKTTLTLGLCAALAARGLAVQPFKKGPDYIDPSWLTAASSRPCRTLDPFFMPGEAALEKAFSHGAVGADISLVEGNHGLYDSAQEDGRGSTAQVARALQAPIILVVNAARMSRSVAAVVLNNVAQGRHESKLRRAIERHCRIPVVGAIPRREALRIPDRHLGLIPRGEDDGLAPAIAACQRVAESHIDLDQVLSIARSTPPLPSSQDQPGGARRVNSNGKRPVIGVLRDRAFSFYYPANLEALEEAGARLVFIDALEDSRLPILHCLYIGGGFPEVFMEALSANRSLRQEIREAVEADLPVYAECGGLMYLTRRIHWGERSAEMVGVLPCETVIRERPEGHGYVIAETCGTDPYFPTGSILRGHEFHHSQLIHLDSSTQAAYRLLRGRGLGQGRDGLVYRNVLAAYTHLHALGSPDWAPALVARARAHARETHQEASHAG